MTDFIIKWNFIIKWVVQLLIRSSNIKTSLWFLPDSLLIYVSKITCRIPKEFSLNFIVFILITICLVFCLKNKTFVVMTQKFYIKERYWVKPCESLSFLNHLTIFTICRTSLLVKILFSMKLKSANFIVSLSLFCIYLEMV